MFGSSIFFGSFSPNLNYHQVVYFLVKIDDFKDSVYNYKNIIRETSIAPQFPD